MKKRLLKVITGLSIPIVVAAILLLPIMQDWNRGAMISETQRVQVVGDGSVVIAEEETPLAGKSKISDDYVVAVLFLSIISISASGIIIMEKKAV